MNCGRNLCFGAGYGELPKYSNILNDDGIRGTRAYQQGMMYKMIFNLPK
jgi:hypothetical protein